jgi:AraC family transcriptional regulator of adaptative response / methylphosphotriester-DNA alkyltransferase methyltransferase
VHPETLAGHHRLYLLARVVVARHYRRELTLAEVAGALSSSPRQLQRAYARFGEHTFKEDLFARRMAAAAELLIEQRAIPVHHVARLVGYRQGAQFARAFRRCYGTSPARFREQGRRHKAASQAATEHAVEDIVSCEASRRPASQPVRERLTRASSATA